MAKPQKTAFAPDSDVSERNKRIHLQLIRKRKKDKRKEQEQL